MQTVEFPELLQEALEGVAIYPKKQSSKKPKLRSRRSLSHFVIGKSGFEISNLENMNTTPNTPSESVDLWPQKLYTQDEVDTLVGKNATLLAFETNAVKQEGQAANSQKKLDKRTVANLVKRSNRILVSKILNLMAYQGMPDSYAINP